MSDFDRVVLVISAILVAFVLIGLGLDFLNGGIE